LGSTNGSQLNGRKVSTAPLEPDSVIDIGRTRIVFSVLAQSAPTEHRSGPRPTSAPDTVRASTVSPRSQLGFPPGEGRHR